MITRLSEFSAQHITRLIDSIHIHSHTITVSCCFPAMLVIGTECKPTVNQPHAVLLLH